MDPSLDTLQANLTEIYHAIRHQPPDSLPLVANGTGTRIYDSRYAWGRLWTWIYQMGTWIAGYDWRIDRLKTAIHHTNNLYTSLKSSADIALNTYVESVRKAGRGYLADEEPYLKARSDINLWNSATRPFIKILDSPLSARFKRLLNFSFGEVSSAARFLDSNDTLFHRCQKVIDMEGRIESPLPYPILNKIIKSKPLNAAEGKELTKWIGKVDGSETSPNTLHKCLQALAAIFRKEDINEENSGAVASLELCLEEGGMKTFNKTDLKHTLWRDKLKTGFRINVNDNSLVLGQELFSDLEGSDDTRAFTLEGHPDKIALIAKNKVLLHLRQLKMRQGAFMGIKAAQIDAVSADGSAAVMERLRPAVSLGQEPNLSADLKTAISRFIAAMVKERQTPLGFTPAMVMINGEGEMTALKPLKAGPFDFNALEDFTLRCSGGDKELFRFLMEDSALAGCKAAMFYDDALKMYLQGNSIPADDLAGIYEISDPKIVDRCSTLLDAVKTLKAALYPKLRALFPDESPSAFGKRINEAILAGKRASATAGFLWPGLENEILKECANGRLPSP